MRKLILVRHAESEWNPIGRYQGLLDPDLTERGVKQAYALAQELRLFNARKIVTSPLKRTLRTARIIAQNLGIPVEEDERIIEIDHGTWSGMLVEEVKEKFPEEFSRWLREPHKVKFENGESLEEVFRRVGDFIEDVKRSDEEEIIVVSHTVPMRCMYCYLLGIELSKFWSFGCDNASYSVVLVEEDRNVLQKLNITCHLGDLYVEAHKAL